MNPSDVFNNRPSELERSALAYSSFKFISLCELINYVDGLSYGKTIKKKMLIIKFLQKIVQFLFILIILNVIVE